MTFAITKNLGGRAIKVLGKYSIDDISKMYQDYEIWKKNADPKKYKIAWYERRIFDDKKHQIMIDFGDYTYFAVIKANKNEWEPLVNYKPTVKLDV